MRPRTMLLAISAMVLGLLSGTAAAGTPAIDAFIRKHMEEAGIIGLGAAILVDRQVVWMRGYGFADKARARPFTPDTPMNIGSISKTFTGAAMMRAVEEGRLALDADINTYLPFKVVNPHYPDEKITLRQLATHTSGITDRWSVYQDTYHYDGDTPEPLAAFMESYFTPDGSRYSKDNFLDARPGTRREYSNIAAGLAGYIVEIATAEPLSDYTRRHFFTPLGMRNTGWHLADIGRDRHSMLYVAQNGLSIPIPLYEGTTYPDGGVRTSVADLSKFFIALLGDGVHAQTRILDERSVAEMRRFQYTDANKPDNVSLQEENSGLFWSTKFNVTRIGHGGSDPGVKTEMLADLSGNTGVILFVNTSLSGEDMRHYLAIFLELWKQAEAMASQPRQQAG